LRRESMATTFDILRVGDRFRFHDEHQTHVKVSPTKYRQLDGDEMGPAQELQGRPDQIGVVWIESHNDVPPPKDRRYGTVPLQDSRKGLHSINCTDGRMLALTTDAAIAARIAHLLNQHGE
jgi:hypothetical protein